MVWHKRFFDFWGDPHAATSAMLFKPNFIQCPEINLLIIMK
jgi:hypothetical protein